MFLTMVSTSEDFSAIRTIPSGVLLLSDPASAIGSVLGRFPVTRAAA